MSRPSLSSCRGLARNVRQVLSGPAIHKTPAWARAFIPTAQRPAEETKEPFAFLLENPRSGEPPKPSATTATPQPKPKIDPMSNLATTFLGKAINQSDVFNVGETIGFPNEGSDSNEPWHFHIYSHKHNTHITVSKPNREAVISLSCGNIGFKKSQRKHYDSAFQLGTYVLDRLYQSPHRQDIRSLEVVLRGFGQGREAVVKVLLGDAGRWLRGTITRVADATRLKFGGSRSPKPRRLG